MRNSTILKYLVSVGKLDTVSYPELIAEICHHIEVKKASNLEASKLSQDVLLGGGKRKIDSQVEYPKQDAGNGGKKSKKVGGNEQNARNRNWGRQPQTHIPWFHEYTPPQRKFSIVFRESEHWGIFNFPPRMKTPVKKRDNSKYYRFHCDIGHTMEDC